MPVANATLSGGENAEAVAAATKAKNRSDNPRYQFVGNANMVRPVQYYVYIFNVSDHEIRIERPWCNFNPADMSRALVIPACPKGQRVSKPYRIADVVQMPLRNDVTRTVTTIGQTGEFLAQDAINPEDPSGSWRTVRPVMPGQSFNEGVNMYRWGLFWTLNETPTDEEVNTARKRLEDNYNALITEAKNLWAMGEKGRSQIGNTHRRAASYFGLEFEWNVLYRTQKECPGCGERISDSAVICKCGATFDWQKAMDLGLRTMDQAVAAGVMEAPEKKPRSKSA